MRPFQILAASAAIVLGLGQPGAAQDQKAARPKFTFTTSVYVGWMPHYYMNLPGPGGAPSILRKWADRYGIEIVLEPAKYGDSITLYTSGKADAIAITNMDLLIAPASGGIDSTVVVMGDFSNGNDAILTRGIKDVAGLAGAKVSLCEGTVSHYLLARALELSGQKEGSLTRVNTTDDVIATQFLGDKNARAVVTWNPMVMQIESQPGVTKIFDSSKIPGEIQDLLVVRTDRIAKDPRLGEALTGAWYEVLALMSQRGAAADAAMTRMAEDSACTLTEFKAQLRTTAMFWTPKAAVEFARGAECKAANDKVRKFCFEQKLLGEEIDSADRLGISFPDGSVLGDQGRIRVRFDTSFMEQAMTGVLAK
jgi:NitT/TauT family transport system substrate-binding protein